MNLLDPRKSPFGLGFRPAAVPNHEGHEVTRRDAARNQAFVKLGALRGLWVPFGPPTKWRLAANPTRLPPDPPLRSGFRQRALPFPFAKLRVRVTPAKRLNLLKKFIASTLTTLWKEGTRLLGKQLAGRVHG
jgi:hypothetical protein